MPDVYMSSLLGIFLIQALLSAADVSHAVAIDPEHTLLLIGGRKMNSPSMAEYGMNIVGLGPGESLRLAISEKTGRTRDLGDPSLGLQALFSARVTRVDRNSVVIERNVTRYNVPDTVLAMIRQNNALFIGTSNGLYILRDDRFTRFRFEPNLNGKFEPVREPMP